MTDHLPDCDDYAFSGAGFHPNCERICICRQVLRIERRALDAAREAVAALEPRLKLEKYKGGYDCCGCSTTYDLMEDALAAIDALKEAQ